MSGAERTPPAAARRRPLVRVLRVAVLLALFGAGPLVYTTQPLLGVPHVPPTTRADPRRLERHVRELAEDCAPRDARHPENLERAARYVEGELAALLGAAELQSFEAGGRTHQHVIARAGPERAERIVVGAHYDAAAPGIGADDNASGVAGLIELAALLAREPPALRIELVAFALEEPPYFRTRSMGSRVHAEALRGEGVDLRAMLSLEMIGCFRDEPGSQSYPAPGLGLVYPSAGNFIAVVSCLGQASLTRRVKRAMAGAMTLPVRSINAPRLVPGIDFSDQLNYWDAGYPAAMITDTAFYRNPRYHTADDTPDTLDYARMAQVVEGVHAAVTALARD